MGTSTIDPVLFTISPSWISLGSGLAESGDLPIVTEDDNTNIISFQVEGHTLDAAAELNHLSGLDLGKSEHSGNTITNGDHSTEFLQVVLYTKFG